MTLREMIQTIPEDRLIKVGFQAAFSYEGPASGLEAESAKEAELIRLKKARKEAKVTLKNLPDSTSAKKRRSLEKQIANYDKKIKEWTPWMDREVTDSFEAIDGRLAIIAKGPEVGRFWLVGQSEVGELDQDACEVLAREMILAGADDLRKGLESMVFGADADARAKGRRRATIEEEFFHSARYKRLTDLDGEYVINRIKKEVKRKELASLLKIYERRKAWC